MKIKKLFSSILLLAALGGCNPMKQLQTHQSSLTEAYEAGNYTETLIAYNRLKDYQTSKGNPVSTEYLKMAAKSAIETEQFKQAEEILQQWISESSDFEAIELLAKVYNQTGSKDKEYNLLDKYYNQIESDEMKREISTRLFAIEMDRKEYEKALERANQMPPMNDPRIVFMRVEALDATGRKDEARKVCNNLLEKDPDYKSALEWKGKDIYERAEEWYKSEMSKYNKNPDYTTYVYLKRELKKISALYRQGLEIFEQLHEEEPKNQKYIKYLKNIYLRLDMREKAAKMDMLLDHQR
jgi:tetratricopeptide (TPR) repeat protein